MRGGVWVEGGWRGNKGGGCESSVSKLANRLCIPIYTAFADLDEDVFDLVKAQSISIHEAFAGCDPTVSALRSWLEEFQSTQPSQAVT